MSSLVGNVLQVFHNGGTGVTAFTETNFNWGVASGFGSPLILVAGFSIVSKNNTVVKLTSITDSYGNTWHKAGQTSTTGINQSGITSGPVAQSVEIWYAQIATAGLSNTNTFTWTTDSDLVDSIFICAAPSQGRDITNPLDLNASFPATVAMYNASSTAKVTLSGLTTNTAHFTSVFVCGSIGPGQRPGSGGNFTVGGGTTFDYGAPDTFHLNQNYNILNMGFTDFTSAWSGSSIQAHDATNQAIMIAVVITNDVQSFNGVASGDLITATTSLIAGTATIVGSAPGDLITVTTSWVQDAAAAGVTLTATASLPQTGVAVARAVDGGKIFETNFVIIPTTHYQEADYDSIYSRGRREQNGLITTGDYGWTNVFAGFIQAVDNNYAHALGNGPSSGAPDNIGGTWWFEGDQPLDIRAFRFAGTQLLVPSAGGTFTFKGGFGPHNVEPDSYAQEFDAFISQQGPDSMPGAVAGTIIATEFITTPKLPALYSHYEFTYAGGPHTQGRFCEELHLKIAHSNLDGGDRRSTNGRLEKQVQFTMSAHWASVGGGSFVVAADGLFDGLYESDNSADTSKSSHYVSLQSNALTNTPVSTVGAYLQFVFPRPVVFQRLMLSVQSGGSNREVYDSGDEPTKYGEWHWEYSKNSGTTWAACTESWSFMAGVEDMLAPRDGRSFFDIDTSDAGVGPTGVTHWRMVLDQGPAFGAGLVQAQFIFDLFDASGQAPTFAVNFTDDTDGAPIAIVLGGPGTAYRVALSDSSDDALTFAFTNTPNPVLTCNFDDGGTFDTWSDLYPSVVVQTIVVTSGR